MIKNAGLLINSYKENLCQSDNGSDNSREAELETDIGAITETFLVVLQHIQHLTQYQLPIPDDCQ